MPRYHPNQEKKEKEKAKPEIKKARINQDKFEKGKIWAISKDFIKETRILTDPCPKCKSDKITVEKGIFTCTKCGLNYRKDKLFGIVIKEYEQINIKHRYKLKL